MPCEGTSQNARAQKVLIVGAGPVGLFTALKLAQEGINIDVIEKLREQAVAPRAAGYYGPTLAAMKKARVYDSMLQAGYLEHGLLFRAKPVDNGEGGKTFGKEIGYISDQQLMLPQSKLARLLELEGLATGRVRIHYGKEAIAIEQTDEDVTVTARDIGGGELTKFTAPYMVGTDGGKSNVRRLLGVRFLGHTWPERVIATDVRRINDEISHVSPHFVVDPINWSVVIPLSPPAKGRESLWRYGMTVDSNDTRSDEELLQDDNLRHLYDKLMVGNRPLQYQVLQKSVYHIHQRLASTMRRGRCLLAGDAAHLCNPIGAMGLSTGLLDAEAVADALAMALNEGYPDSILDVYSDARREVFGFFVDPMTTQNKLRLAGDPDEVEQEDGFIRLLKHPPPGFAETSSKIYHERWRTDMRAKVASVNTSSVKV